MMKKLLLLAAMAIMSVGAASAQGDDFWTVRAGATFSKLSNAGSDTSAQAGFSVAGLFSHTICESQPIVIQTGLEFNMKGAKGASLAGGEMGDFKSYNLEIPLLFGYWIDLPQAWSMTPFVGGYYSAAVCGTYGEDPQAKPYKKEGDTARVLNVSDLGLRGGLTFDYSRYSLTFAYDAGLMNCYTKSYRDAGLSTKTQSYSLSFGYKFM